MLHDEDEARDVVQEVFLKLWEAENEIGNPQAFVIRSVRNACLNRIAAADTRERICRRLSLEDVDHDVDIETQCEEVRRAVRTILSTRECQVVDMIYAGRLSYKEAAESLDVSVALINKSIVSALKKLRTYFKTQKR